MLKWFLLLLIASSQSLFSDLEDHLKKVSDKSDDHRMRNIDFIYMINLDQRPEKFHQSLEQLAPYGISPYRFSAVNGWELSLEAINDLGIKYEAWMQSGILGTSYSIQDEGKETHGFMHSVGKTYFCHCMPKGSIGIVLSHLSILQDALNSGYETIWIMEDDVEVIRDPRTLPDLIDELDREVGKGEWDVLFTDQDTKGQDGNYVPCFSFARRPNFVPANPDRFAMRSIIGQKFLKIGARYGAYSMIVRQSGMKKILNFIKNYHVFLPYDMEYTLPSNIRLYSLIDDVVSTLPKAASDNGAPNYKKQE